jgi:hypothetical protein
MAKKETPEKKESDVAGPPTDDPLLRSKLGNIDKTLGSEEEQLAEKRLAALKRAREMPSA